MKGFKATGNGPKYGSFAFPSKAGFGPSSGKVKSISGYTRRAGKRVQKKAVGGIVEDNIVEAPGFSDYSEGGKVKTTFRVFERRSNRQIGKTSKSAEDALKKRDKLDRKAGSYVHGFEEVKKARGGKVPGVSNPMTAREAMAGSVGFNRTPKIGK